jgi:phosphate transport system protein
MTTQFEHNLENVKSKLLLMGQLANDSVKGAMKALLEKDSTLAKMVRTKDEEIDLLENEISDSVTTYLSTHAPVAADLRLLVATMKISHEIERIGDESKAIARRSRKTVSHEFHKIPEMAKIAQQMIQEALNTFIEYNETKAKAIWRKDLEVDQLHIENNQFCQQLVEANPALASSIFEVLFISKSLERIADHAVSISKETVFMATSRDVRHAPEFKKSALRKQLE